MHNLQKSESMAGSVRHCICGQAYRGRNPSAAELGEWWKKSGLPLKKFFNTSGLLYKEQGLKDKLPLMDEQSQLELLATNGMLVKRPLVIGEDFVLVGFKESEWAETLKP